MNLVAEFTLPVSEFALEDAFEAVPELCVEAERVVAHPTGRLLPYLWTRGGSPDAVDEAVRSDETTAEVSKLNETDNATLYHVEWNEHVSEAIERLLSSDPVVLTGCATRDGWDFTMRFRHREDLSKLQTELDRASVDAELKRLHTPELPTTGGQFVLTEKQYEAFHVALEAGYFEVPRETNLSELSDEIGISSQAVSKRLRRAQQTLGQRVLATGPNTIPEE
ncbi:helix-turn-helix domain-containing protein [Halorussus halophilus]|uniref:helix-turn-helix domain-containing protein n=1 Tax=Halorussus halophilus TaxID=2650975 RepID=UPI00130132C5|nr:helix-turn-helix domain-containing protein [Halorussus halophilus]